MPDSYASQGKLAQYEPLGRGKRTQLPARHQDDIRKKIQCIKLINRVQDHALGQIEMTQSQLYASFKLIDKVLSNAIPDAIAANNQAQAIESIQRAQLVAMAQEMLRQGQLDASTLTVDSCTLAEDAHVIEHVPATVETSTDESE